MFGAVGFPQRVVFGQLIQPPADKTTAAHTTTGAERDEHNEIHLNNRYRNISLCFQLLQCERLKMSDTFGAVKSSIFISKNALNCFLKGPTCSIYRLYTNINNSNVTVLVA